MNGFEVSILLWIHENLRGFMDGFWIHLTSLADKGRFWILVGVVLLLFKKTRTAGLTVLIALLLDHIMTNLILKDLFARPRPYTVDPAIVTLIKPLRSYSFPSGHTSVSFSAAFVLCRMTSKKLWIPAVVLAAMIGFSRMYVGVHYPTDVLGGIAVSLIASTAAYYLVQFVKKHTGEKK